MGYEETIGMYLDITYHNGLVLERGWKNVARIWMNMEVSAVTCWKQLSRYGQLMNMGVEGMEHGYFYRKTSEPKP